MVLKSLNNNEVCTTKNLYQNRIIYKKNNEYYLCWPHKDDEKMTVDLLDFLRYEEVKVLSNLLVRE